MCGILFEQFCYCCDVARFRRVMDCTAERGSTKFSCAESNQHDQQSDSAARTLGVLESTETRFETHGHWSLLSFVEASHAAPYHARSELEGTNHNPPSTHSNGLIELHYLNCDHCEFVEYPPVTAISSPNPSFRRRIAGKVRLVSRHPVLMGQIEVTRPNCILVRNQFLIGIKCRCKGIGDWDLFRRSALPTPQPKPELDAVDDQSIVLIDIINPSIFLMDSDNRLKILLSRDTLIEPQAIHLRGVRLIEIPLGWRLALIRVASRFCKVRLPDELEFRALDIEQGQFLRWYRRATWLSDKSTIPSLLVQLTGAEYMFLSETSGRTLRRWVTERFSLENCRAIERLPIERRRSA